MLSYGWCELPNKSFLHIIHDLTEDICTNVCSHTIVCFILLTFMPSQLSFIKILVEFCLLFPLNWEVLQPQEGQTELLTEVVLAVEELQVGEQVLTSLRDFFKE